MQQSLLDLERSQQLIRISQEVDPHLEMAEIQRRAYAVGAPAILFENVKGSPFPAVCNLFGTLERARFIFRHTLPAVKRAVQLKADPSLAMRKPFSQLGFARRAIHALPRKTRNASVLFGQTEMSQLPQLVSWPDDGGAYITLPQVCTENPDQLGPKSANLGMYRIQMSGNDFIQNKELGLHYQIHRGIGVHHSRAAQKGERLPVSIFVGGHPAHSLAAVMPLPEGLSELMFAGLLAGRRFRWTRKNGHLISADADFCIVGSIAPDAVKPEGPFGDHLGYYSLTHDFPLMEVEAVYHKKGAIWPFTVVGRPPQEDTTFGALIHEIAAPMVPISVPGLVDMHAVDAAGVHPLLLATGHERYVPYQERRPMELLTVANAVLGFGQASLAKYLIIAAHEDEPTPDAHDISAFFKHVLERVDWSRDLHFQTRTTIDTLDYSGSGLNQGSKLVIAAAGKIKRKLINTIPDNFQLTENFKKPIFASSGILMIQASPYSTESEALQQINALCKRLENVSGLEGVPLMILVDDSEFAAANLNNFLWTTFTRSNPSHDVHGVRSFVEHKHWGCHGPLLIDARIKPHHAPPLIEDPAINRRVDALAVKGGPFEGLW